MTSYDAETDFKLVIIIIMKKQKLQRTANLYFDCSGKRHLAMRAQIYHILRDLK